jgi:hypothetical protein
MMFVFCSRLVSAYVFDVHLPKALVKHRLKANSVGADAGRMTQSECEYVLEPGVSSMDMLSRYMDQVLKQ